MTATPYEMLMGDKPEGEEYRLAVLRTIADQHRELLDSTSPLYTGPRVTCPCGKAASLQYLYRCFFCGIYWCSRCAARHFKGGPHP